MLIPSFLPKDVDSIIHCENGILGAGVYSTESEKDPDLINAAGEPIKAIHGASVFSSSTSFGIIRGAHLDLTIIGGLQVSEDGDLANWVIPGKVLKGMGGAMDLTSSGSKCIVCMEHTNKDKLKVLKKCTLPITAKNVVSLLITNLGVFEFRKDTGMTLIEIADGVSLDEIKSKTEANYVLASNITTMKQ